MDPLNRPVWNALTTHQSDFAIGDRSAVRMMDRYGPFGAAADTSPESLAALSALVPLDGELWMIETDTFAAPPGTFVKTTALLVQMVADTIALSAKQFEIVPLTGSDSAEIHALAVLTAPGPSHEGTSELGRFVGIRVGGRLVAMAGERMRPPGHIEVSGVCTHPDFRGRGYAAALICHVATQILEDGDTPFLHSYASNSGAIALYETLGFRSHHTIMATVIGSLA